MQFQAVAALRWPFCKYVTWMCACVRACGGVNVRACYRLATLHCIMPLSKVTCLSSQSYSSMAHRLTLCPRFVYTSASEVIAGYTLYISKNAPPPLYFEKFVKNWIVFNNFLCTIFRGNFTSENYKLAQLTRIMLLHYLVKKCRNSYATIYLRYYCIWIQCF